MPKNIGQLSVDKKKDPFQKMDLVMTVTHIENPGDDLYVIDIQHMGMDQYL